MCEDSGGSGRLIVTWPGGDSTMPKRSELTVEQRREAVLALLRREEPAAQLARRYGVSEQTLYRWRDDFLAAGEAALVAGTRNGVSSQDRRVAELERQIEKRD